MKNNNLSVFNNEVFGSVRTFIDDKGNPWFVASDVARALGYKKTRNAVAKHCFPKGALERGVLTEGGVQKMVFINEPNLYRLVMRSHLPSAEKFQDWIFEEVLPSIRKHGGYILNQETMDEAEFEDALSTYSESFKQEAVQVYNTMVNIEDEFLTLNNAVKIICQDGKIGVHKLFKLLRDKKILTKNSSNNNVPTSAYTKNGWFKVKLNVDKRGYKVGSVTLISPKGMIGINKILNKHHLD